MENIMSILLVILFYLVFIALVYMISRSAIYIIKEGEYILGGLVILMGITLAIMLIAPIVLVIFGV